MISRSRHSEIDLPQSVSGKGAYVSCGEKMRTDQFLKPGPIFLILWVIGYVIWAFYVPREWDEAAIQFLTKIRIRLDFVRALFGIV